MLEILLISAGSVLETLFIMRSYKRRDVSSVVLKTMASVVFVLLGLLEQGSNAAAAMLAAQHITAQRVRNALVELVGRGIPAQVQEETAAPVVVMECREDAGAVSEVVLDGADG